MLFFYTKGLLRNKFSGSGEVILFGNEAKNAGIAELRRGFFTKLASKRTSINGVVISQQALSLFQYKTNLLAASKEMA